MSSNFSTDFFLINLFRLIVRAVAFFSLGVALIAVAAWAIFKIYPDSRLYFEVEVAQEPRMVLRLPSISFRDFLNAQSVAGNSPDSTSSIESMDPLPNYTYPDSKSIDEALNRVFGTIAAPSKLGSGRPKQGLIRDRDLTGKAVIALIALAKSLGQLTPNPEEISDYLKQSLSSIPIIEDRNLSEEFLSGFTRECIAWKERLSLGDEQVGIKTTSWYEFPVWYSKQFSSVLEDYLNTKAQSEEPSSFESKLNNLIKSPNLFLALAASSFASYLICAFILVFLAVPLRLEQALSEIYIQLGELRQSEKVLTDAHHNWTVE